jgi:Glucose / Sorbosone dehydrogenase
MRTLLRLSSYLKRLLCYQVILMRPLGFLYLLPCIIITCIAVDAVAAPQALRSDIIVKKIINTVSTSPSIRVAKLPDGRFIYLKLNGDIFLVDLARGTQRRAYTTAQHHLSNTQGLAVGPNGVFYIVGNEDLPNNQTKAKIAKGVWDVTLNKRIWSVLAETASYPKSNTAFDHRFNGIVVSPTSGFLYVNSGSRTDHGEIQTAGGLYPNTREVGLTACILRLPANGANILLPNNRVSLRSAGYIFAEGTRNAFDMAFAPNGDLFGTENGPDRDMSEELNWLRLGRHYGFPWRIGGEDNPQQFPDYNPALDLLLNNRFIAVRQGFYHNDSAFPKRPARILVEPIINLGPDADSFRDPVDGLVKDASDLGRPLGTFTTHRSPLGLVFDRTGAMSPEFQGDGFMLSWTPGDPLGQAVAGPFHDASQDLLNLNLMKIGQSNYQLQTTRIVGGFNHPIDAEIIGNKIYVLEYGGTQGIWQVTIPPKIQ